MSSNGRKNFGKVLEFYCQYEGKEEVKELAEVMFRYL